MNILNFKISKKIVLSFFILLFFILSPALIFYAVGNTLGDSWKILQTGGIYIRSLESDSEIYINSKLNKTTSYFQRNILIKNLHPGIYSVLVKKDGYTNWSNEIKVSGNLVSDTRAFLLPEKIDIIEISKYLESDISLSTSSKSVAKKNNPEYQKIVSIFSTSTNFSGTKEDPIINRNFELWKSDKDVFLKWTGRIDSIPRMFCIDDICDNVIKVFSFDKNVKSLDFFPGDTEIILVSTEDVLYAIESEMNFQKFPKRVYSGKTIDFRIVNNNVIYVKDLDFYGQVVL